MTMNVRVRSRQIEPRLRLRVKDIEFTPGQIILRDRKGEKDRVTMLPESVKQSLAGHLQKVKLLHDEDVASGYGDG